MKKYECLINAIFSDILSDEFITESSLETSVMKISNSFNTQKMTFNFSRLLKLLYNCLSYFLITARSTNLADFIQPSLVQLQPNLDDFMDTLDPPGIEIKFVPL